MSPLTRSLLALATAALLQGACAEPQRGDDSHCTSVSHGSVTDHRIDLSPTSVPKGLQASTVDIPNPCRDNDTPIGEVVMVCDDVPPTVYLPDLPQYSPATIIRNGNYNAQVAPISVIFWCPRG